MSEPVLLWGPHLLNLYFYLYFTLSEEGGDLTYKYLEGNQILGWFCPSRCFVSAGPSVGIFSGDESPAAPSFPEGAAGEW